MRIDKVIQTINRYLFIFGAIPLCIATILTVIDVSGRYFRFPLPGTLEISTLCLALSIMLTLAHTQAIKENTVVDVLFNFMPPQAKKVTTLITTVLSLIIVGVVAWQAFFWVGYSIRTQEWVDILGWPLWIFKSFLLIGFICLFLQLLLDVIDCVLELRGKISDIGLPEIRTAARRTLQE